MKLWELFFTNEAGREIVFRFMDKAKAEQQAALYHAAGVNVRLIEVWQTSDHSVPWAVTPVK